MQRLFGLIGYPLSHSFSKGYFSEKFAREGISNAVYELFPLENIAEFPRLLNSHPHLCGLNVTIPYKEQVIPYLNDLDDEAKAIGAVNTIAFRGGKTTGFNTDVYGFEMSFKKHLKAHHTKALVLGTGGASKAVVYALNRLGISWQYVSRTEGEGILNYAQISKAKLADTPVIINTTPLGMYPKIDQLPPLPYEALSPEHYLYDLVYNPAETAFLQQGKAAGAIIDNGLEMLYLQAEKAWEIWNRQ